MMSYPWYKKLITDKTMVKHQYKRVFGKPLDLQNPKTFNQKIQWLKLYDRKPQYTKMVDKLEAKEYVSSIIGEEYVIPTIGVWNSFDDIDLSKLPEQFVLKCTHDSGGLVICKDKRQFNIAESRDKLQTCLNNNFYWMAREWPYKNVKPRIIAEPYLEDMTTHDLRDYKFFTFSGKPKLLFIATERQAEETETKFDFFDMDFNHLPIKNGHPNATVAPQKPLLFSEMKVIAEKLSQGTPQLRVDLYQVNGKVLFGELTFSHWGGLVPFDPEEWDEIMGEWIVLPSIK